METSAKIFSCTQSIELANIISQKFGIQLGKVNFSRYSDGEFQPSFEESVRGARIFIIGSTQPSSENLMEMLLMLDAAKRSSARHITAVLPYYGWARQDRKDKPRVPIAAKLTASLLETAGATRIITMDLHSTQIQGFTSIPVDNLYGSLVLIEELEAYFNKIKNDNKCVVLSPDIGSNKLSQSYAKKLGIGFALIDKRRNAHNQSEVAHLVGNLENRHVLIIDDMIDTAGTIFNAAVVAKEKGALSVTVAATHAVLSGDAVKKLSSDNIDKVFLSDTVHIPENKKFEKLTIISSAKVFADTINRIHKGESVSQLFGKVT